MSEGLLEQTEGKKDVDCIMRLTPVDISLLVPRLPWEIGSVGTEIPTIQPVLGDKTPLNVA